MGCISVWAYKLGIAATSIVLQSTPISAPSCQISRVLASHFYVTLFCQFLIINYNHEWTHSWAYQSVVHRSVRPAGRVTIFFGFSRVEWWRFGYLCTVYDNYFSFILYAYVKYFERVASAQIFNIRWSGLVNVSLVVPVKVTCGQLWGIFAI